MRVLAWGILLTFGVTGVLWMGWGVEAIIPGFTFGGAATAIQMGAVAAVRPVRGAAFEKFLSRWAVGMGLRLVGVVAIVVAVLVDRDLFPPVPTAFGFLGVLLPLLFAETRFLE